MRDRSEPTPVALYARVSSDRQDVDLSVAAQLRALRDHADRNGYVVVREYVDEAVSGRVDDRPEFNKMIDEARSPGASFQEVLVWKFSRFTRKREHAVAYKSLLRRRGVRVVSITERTDDTPTGNLTEGIIETVDEFYSEDMATDIRRGMREAASRGFWVSSRTPYGYNRVMVQDGAKERPKLQPDDVTAPVVKRIFDMAENGTGMLDIARAINDEDIPSATGKLWSSNGVHFILRNEVYTGTLVWGTKAKDEADLVRVEEAFPAIVSDDQFRRVNSPKRSRASKTTHPRRIASSYLLSGLVKCYRCKTAFTGHGAKSGRFHYYVCQSLIKRGSGSCDSPRLNALHEPGHGAALNTQTFAEEDCEEPIVRTLLGLGDECEREMALKVAGYFDRYAPALPHLRDIPPGIHHHAVAYWGGLGTDPFERFDTCIEAESFVGDPEMVRAYGRMEAIECAGARPLCLGKADRP